MTPSLASSHDTRWHRLTRRAKVPLYASVCVHDRQPMFRAPRQHRKTAVGQQLDDRGPWARIERMAQLAGRAAPNEHTVPIRAHHDVRAVAGNGQVEDVAGTVVEGDCPRHQRLPALDAPDVDVLLLVCGEEPRAARKDLEKGDGQDWLPHQPVRPAVG
eukprot:CAMPEP_0176336798 /NCGR_PEP_ID=MMETSP0121_2-20121125/79304_1 /TAXON_ID=160619 /ORGANISM="Kryptoperidinium foliaceum, Strain CCMP 1326" /LENGTH=158 /DNA_ID=CAMNT_0017679791 /DNA_START=102 /DNA_END=575 /DNA_ORIENTATION=+